MDQAWAFIYALICLDFAIFFLFLAQRKGVNLLGLPAELWQIIKSAAGRVRRLFMGLADE